MTENELLEAIRQAQSQAENVEGALSTEEIREALGMGEHKARRLLRELLKSGKAEAVRCKTLAMNGVVVTTTKYRVRPVVLLRAS